MHLRSCRACGRAIVFLTSPAGKRIPVDALSVHERDTAFDAERHVSHFTTCLDPKRFSQAAKIAGAAKQPAAPKLVQGKLL